MRAWTGYEFDRMADQQGFVLYPDGYKHNRNDCRKIATFPAKAANIVDDMGFIRALIDQVTAAHAINPKRVYAFGYSNGGHMACRLAIEDPSELAAIAALGASLPTQDSSSRSQLGETSRAMLVDGTDDPINPSSRDWSQPCTSPVALNPSRLLRWSPSNTKSEENGHHSRARDDDEGISRGWRSDLVATSLIDRRGSSPGARLFNANPQTRATAGAPRLHPYRAWPHPLYRGPSRYLPRRPTGGTMQDGEGRLGQIGRY